MSISIQHYVVYIIVGIALGLFILPMIKFMYFKLLQPKTITVKDEYSYYSSSCSKCSNHKS